MRGYGDSGNLEDEVINKSCTLFFPEYRPALRAKRSLWSLVPARRLQMASRAVQTRRNTKKKVIRTAKSRSQSVQHVLSHLRVEISESLAETCCDK